MPARSTVPPIRLLSRDGCHLCAEAVDRLVAAAGPAGGRWTPVDVDSDPELRAEWGDMVPVLLVGEQVIEWGPISSEAIGRALVAADRSSP